MIGLLTNLPNNIQFLKKHLSYTKADELMAATGGNTGNVAFVHAVQAILSDKYQIIDWGSNHKYVSEKFDRIILCCANQIGSHIDLKNWGKRLEMFGLPVTLIGLGSQSNKIGKIPAVPDGTIEFLKVVSALKPNNTESNILTRGAFTTDVLKHYGFNSFPYGCPSLLTSRHQNLGNICLANQSRKKIKRVMVPAGNPFHPSSCIEKKLVELVNTYNGEYILQHPEIVFKLALNNPDSISEKHKNLLMDVYKNFKTIDELEDWFRANAIFFADAPNWLNYCRKFSTAIGPRYHGVALAVQAGVPGKVITIDSRTEELAATTGIPFINYKELKNLATSEVLDLSYWSKEDAEHFDEIRHRNSKNYIKFLENNNLTPQSHLFNL